MKINFMVALLLVMATFNSYADESVKRILHPNIKSKVAEWCSAPLWCGHLVMVDCRSSLDGPLYYFNNNDGALLMSCGGDCLLPKDVKEKLNDPLRCTKCPPTEWQNCLQENKAKTK